jgi:ABC-2 type transport system ATP-binding protein
VRADPQGVRRTIGYLPENVRFYDSLTMLENLRFFGELSGLRRPEHRIRDVLRILEFEGHEDQRLGSFSKGMRQRVGIAQAILHAPKVLFLDEPTSGLDPEGVRTLRETIVRLNREFGITVFMNTHLLSEVTKTCTSIAILRRGRLVHHASLVDTLAAFPDEDSLEDVYFRLESRPSA